MIYLHLVTEPASFSGLPFLNMKISRRIRVRGAKGPGNCGHIGRWRVRARRIGSVQAEPIAYVRTQVPKKNRDGAATTTGTRFQREAHHDNLRQPLHL